METNSFVDLIKKFGNNSAENPQNRSSNNQNNTNLDAIYPYGQFPIEKTKNYDPLAHKKNLEIESLAISKTSPDDQNKEEKTQSLFGNIDLKTILPLLTGMKNKNKLTTYDLFNLLMPTMYKDNPNLKEIVKYFSNNEEPKKSKLPPSKMQAIDSYVKA